MEEDRPENLDKIEETALETLGRQPMHIRMIHRIVDDRTEEDIPMRVLQDRMDNLAERDLVERKGQNYSKVSDEHRD